MSNLLDRIRAQFLSDHPLSLVLPSPDTPNTYSILDRTKLKLDAAPAPAPVPVYVPAPVLPPPQASASATQAMLSQFGLAPPQAGASAPQAMLSRLGGKTKVRQVLMTIDASDEFELIDD